MLRDSITEALRRLRAHTVPTVVSLLGLSVALAVTVLVGQYVYHETTFDAFHEQAPRIQRVVIDSPDLARPSAKLPAAAAAALVEGVPEIEAAVRFRHAPTEYLVEAGPDGTRVSSLRDDLLFADGEVADVFSFDAVAGDLGGLKRPSTIALTERAAQSFFGDRPAVGETVTLERSVPLEVVAVLANPSERSSLQFGLMASEDAFASVSAASGRPADASAEWYQFAYDTYVLLRTPDADPGRLADAARQAIASRAGDQAITEHSVGFEPLGDARLRSAVTDGLAAPGAPAYLAVLVGVALLLLLVAVATYANLTVARSLRNTHEVGVRQALGATPGSVAAHYLIEAVVLSTGALLVGLALARLALPAFQAAIAVPVEIHYSSPLIWLGLLALVALTGLAAGAYPATVLSRLSPDAALRDRSVLAGAVLRKGLVAFQFAATVFLVSTAAVLAAQLQHLRTLPLGYQPEDVVVVPLRPGPSFERSAALISAFESLAAVEAVTAGTAVPTAFGEPDGTVEPVGPSTFGAANALMHVVGTDSRYADVLGLTLASGRFLRDTAADSGRAVVINQAAARQLGWSDPVGRQLTYWGGAPRTVVGVVEDFYQSSPRVAAQPTVFAPRSELWASILTVRLQPGTRGALGQIQDAWSSTVAEEPFEGYTLAGAVEETTAEEARLAAAFGGFALVAILIACLGLSSLVAFAAERRTREIGVRSALGASDWNVAATLGGEFAPLIGIGFVVALPAAVWVTRRWLSGFAAPMELTPWPFLSAGLLAAGLAGGTVLWRGLLAARVPPAHSLRAD